jgi:hypothetical protein
MIILKMTMNEKKVKNHIHHIEVDLMIMMMMMLIKKKKKMKVIEIVITTIIVINDQDVIHHRLQLHRHRNLQRHHQYPLIIQLKKN